MQKRFVLSLLGTIELRDNHGADVPVIAQPKRLAILSWLAIARPRGFHQRDKLLALFWPEMDQERARAALSQAVYTLRRALGNDALVTRGATDLGLADDMVATDVDAFEAAITRGDLAGAMSIYRGDLLEGFHLGGAPGFDEWLETERSRLRDMARKAAAKLAAEAQAADDAPAAAAWARTAFLFAPYDEAELRRLLRLMEYAGDSAGAARVYQDFARRLAAEMEREPAAETKAVLARVLESDGEDSVAVATPRVAEQTSQGKTVKDESTDDSGDVTPPGVPRQRRRLTHRTARGIAVAATLLITTAVSWALLRARSTKPDANHIAVLPFQVRGPAEYQYLSQGIVALLSAGLDGAANTTVVDPQAILSLVDQRRANAHDRDEGSEIAARFGAGSFITGDVVAAGPSLQITARLFTGDGHQSASASVVAFREADVLTAVDSLARTILSERIRSPAQRLARVGLLATPSFAAAKAYLDGEGHYRNGRYEQAFDAYRRAVAIDSTFAIAYYRLATVADWVNETSVITPSLDNALKYSARADLHERRLINALALFWRGSTFAADTAYASLLRSYPEDIDAWYQYGELVFHQGMYLGRPLQAAERPFRRVVALQPDHKSALAHIMRIAARAGRVALVDSVGRIIDRITSNMERMPEVPLLRAYALHDTAAIERYMSGIHLQPDYPVWVAAWRIAAYTGDMSGALRIIRSDMRTERGEQYRAAAYLSAAHFEAARGRFRAADSLTMIASSLDPEGAIRTRAFLAALPFAPLDHSRLQAVSRSLTERVVPVNLAIDPVRAHLNDAHMRPLLLSLLSTRTGDIADAESWRVAAHAEPRDGPLIDAFENSMCGAIAAVNNDVAEKKAALDAWATQNQTLYFTPKSTGFTYAFENYTRATLCEQLGRDREALEWYDAFGNDFGYDVVFFAPAALRRAQILEKRGDRAGAAAEYERFLKLWKNADSELQPQVRAARDRLKALRPLR